MIAKEDKVSYTFSHTDCEGLTVTVTQEFPWDSPWTDALQSFVQFLETCTFVGVKQKVSIEDSPFVSDNWTGPVHPAPEED